MRSLRFVPALFLLLWAAGGPVQAQGLLPEVKGRRLSNGVEILVSERPGLAAVHALLLVKGGRADTGGLPPVAAELLAESVFRASPADETGHAKELEPLLAQEEGLHEAIRLERIRLARHTQGTEGTDLQDLLTAERQVDDRISALAKTGTPGPWEALGAGSVTLSAEADYISLGMDLPATAFPAYVRLLADQLGRPLLARFPLEREGLATALASGGDWGHTALSAVLNAALPGQPYSQVWNQQPEALETLGWTSMRSYAKGALGSERLLLILVGGLSLDNALPTLEKSLGTLTPGSALEDQRLRPSGDLPMPLGFRRVEANLPGQSRLFMTWRVPPAGHPDHPLLGVLTQLLRGQARGGARLEARLGVPGGKDPGLLVIEGFPAERQSLADLEQYVQGEVVRLQRGAFREGELRQAQRFIETGQELVQEDAAGLADAIGRAACEAGDWRAAFSALQVKRDYSPQEVQDLARKYLVPEQALIGWFEPDPLLAPLDRLESDTAKVLTRILETKYANPGQVQAAVREALRQLRLLPASEREQTLKLLQAQVKP